MRAAVRGSDPSDSPRSSNCARARAAWSTRRDSAASGMPRLMKTNSRGSSAPGSVGDPDAPANPRASDSRSTGVCVAGTGRASTRGITLAGGRPTGACARTPVAASRTPAASAARRHMSVAHTAVPLAEQHEGEVLAADWVLLAGTPDDGAAAEGLAAAPAVLGRVGHRVGQLGLVGGLVHCRQEVGAAEARPAVPAPGQQLAVHLCSQALGD
mmetsp:Transcript_11186/g.21503  ORF Transcript_11186/g.21503 Transcript_11186/m.21503 type:complete len:213 (+) Transcript_11186:317-955(+)